MRNKIIMIAAMLAVMVAMTGIAAAYDVEWLDATGSAPASFPIPLTPGSSITLSYKAYNIDPNSYPPLYGTTGEVLPYYSSVVKLPSSATGTSASQVTVSTPTSLTLTGDPTIDVGKITISLSSAAPVGGKYRVNVGAGSDNPLTVTIEDGHASRSITSVPEFPTVALPIAAVIGLVFFFQQRKNKEE